MQSSHLSITRPFPSILSFTLAQPLSPDIMMMMHSNNRTCRTLHFNLVTVLITVSSLVTPTLSYRIQNSENETKPFVPYEKGFVGSRNESPAMNTRTNPGYEDFAKREASGNSIGRNRLQDCPGMVGPLNDDGKYYCTSKLHGYCDRRSGTCFCNEGYDGWSCNICDPLHKMIGGLCYELDFCPDGSSCDEEKEEKLSCSKFHQYCKRCHEGGCLECIEGYGVNPDAHVGQQCESCQKFDPRCYACNASKCLACTDLLLFSIRRSGRRPQDHVLPFDELNRQLSKSIPFGSQSSEAFDEAELYDLVDAPHLTPLDAYSVSCDQGIDHDASFTCKRIQISNKICGHKGVISFSSPEYVIREDEDHIRLKVQRSGGGVGQVNVSYSVKDITTDKISKDVSETAMYIHSLRQTIVFDNHEGERSFVHSN